MEAGPRAQQQEPQSAPQKLLTLDQQGALQEPPTLDQQGVPRSWSLTGQHSSCQDKQVGIWWDKAPARQAGQADQAGQVAREQAEQYQAVQAGQDRKQRMSQDRAALVE